MEWTDDGIFRRSHDLLPEKQYVENLPCAGLWYRYD